MQDERLELIAEAVHNAWWQEKIKQGVENHPDMLPYNELTEEVKEYDRVTARAVLHNLPELQTWIPVSERLPDDCVNPITEDAYVYPVTVKLGEITDIRYYSFCRGHWYNQGPAEMDGLVIAWMPLPEPYRTEPWKE